MSTDSVRITELTLSSYQLLLESTLTRYPCLGFEVLDAPPAPPARFAIIRHDIDMSPTQALALARIEANLGVRATYTILLTGDFYSPFEFANRQLLRQISDLGHDLGLHFDATWHGIESEAELTDAIAWETSLLNRLLDLPSEQRVKMFSFTTPHRLRCHAEHLTMQDFVTRMPDTCRSMFNTHRTQMATGFTAHGRNFSSSSLIAFRF